MKGGPVGSKELSERAKRLIPGGVNSPVRAFRHVGRDPVWFSHGKGAFLYDTEGKDYIDFCLSFGPLILGHSPSQVVTALREQAERATSFGACHPGEVEMAESLLRGYPFLGKVRLVNSGTEAVMTAVRLARGHTGRDKIIQFEGCYHGHSDGLLAKAGSGVAELSESSSRGVPASVVADTCLARFDDLSTLDAWFAKYPGEIAAVLLEAVPANNGLWIPSREHLQAILERARRHGALVIFDEVITGFRLGLGGACGYFGLEPDIVTLGKIIGGGLPLAALAGKAEIMDSLAPQGQVYQAGTLSGNPLATAAGTAVLRSLFEAPPYETLEARTAEFTGRMAELLRSRYPVSPRRIGSLFWFGFGEAGEGFPPGISQDAVRAYAEFFGRALSAGVYFAPSPYEVGFLSTAHTDSVLEEALRRIERCLK